VARDVRRALSVKVLECYSSRGGRETVTKSTVTGVALAARLLSLASTGESQAMRNVRL